MNDVMNVWETECINLHDSVIEDIKCTENKATLYITTSEYENKRKIEVEINTNLYDFELYYVRRYPRFHMARLKGKEISLETLIFWFSNGFTLNIDEIYGNKNQGAMIIECDLFPYPSRRGVLDKVLFKINKENDSTF